MYETAFSFQEPQYNYKAKHSREYLHCKLKNILRRYKDFLEAEGQH